MPEPISDTDLPRRLIEIQDCLKQGLGKIDPHQRLVGRPVPHKVIAGQTLEIVYREVPQICEAEVRGVKRLIGDECFCSVTPSTAETLTVRFVIPISGKR